MCCCHVETVDYSGSSVLGDCIVVKTEKSSVRSESSKVESGTLKLTCEVGA